MARPYATKAGKTEEHVAAIEWIREADVVTLIGTPPDPGASVHVTVIVAGAPK